jgi:hypothetical protein
MGTIVLAVLVYVAWLALRQKPRPPGPEDGHDRAERRERDWYR